MSDFGICNRLVVKSNAKINLTLSVYGANDDGYHNLFSVMQTIGLYDTITVQEHDLISVTSDNAPCGEENICYKAAKAFSRFGGARIHIEKRIPLAAGLGGGSSNAAAVLLALNRIYGKPFSDERLIKIALSLGSDVPLFLKGGTMLVDGVGEKLSPIKPLSCGIVIIKDGIKSSTGEMYKNLDKIGLVDRRADVKEFIKNIEDGNLSAVGKSLFNDFERVYPCDEIKADLIACGAYGACLSGSGPSVFGIFENIEKAESAALALKDKYKNVFACNTENYGIRFE